MLYHKRVDIIYGLDKDIVFGVKKLGLDSTRLEKTIILNNELSYYFAFNVETHDSTFENFKKAFQKIKKSGRLNAILTKYKKLYSTDK